MTALHRPSAKTATKKKRRDRLSNAKPEAEPAEVVKIDGENVIVQKVNHPSYKEKGKKVKWVADWAGCDKIKGFGIEGDTRDEVVCKVCLLYTSDAADE